MTQRRLVLVEFRSFLRKKYGFQTRGGGLTSIIKVYTDVRLEWGVYFSGLKVYMNGYHFDFKTLKYINGVSFSPKKYMNE